mmetsp:Transcript_19612/g.53892  ORF Transcript_19612/g.53892 Transcript_19612/m.53892 type:complete len:90 (+) Transcript_19612:147-416(+)
MQKLPCESHHQMPGGCIGTELRSCPAHHSVECRTIEKERLYLQKLNRAGMGLLIHQGCASRECIRMEPHIQQWCTDMTTEVGFLEPLFA